MGTHGPGAALHRLPAPPRWLLWLAAAAIASVVVGFAVGLARPRAKGAMS